MVTNNAGHTYGTLGSGDTQVTGCLDNRKPRAHSFISVIVFISDSLKLGIDVT